MKDSAVVFGVLALLGIGLAVPEANGAVVTCTDPSDPALVCAQTRPVTGTDLAQFQFSIDTAGSYEVSVVDLSAVNSAVLGPLETLSLSVINPPSVMTPLVSTDRGAQRFFFQADTYYAQVFAQLSASAQAALQGLGTGMYGITVRAIQVVPIPAAALLFASAFMSLFIARRHQNRK